MEKIVLVATETFGKYAKNELIQDPAEIKAVLGSHPHFVTKVIAEEKSSPKPQPAPAPATPLPQPVVAGPSLPQPKIAPKVEAPASVAPKTEEAKADDNKAKEK